MDYFEPLFRWWQLCGPQTRARGRDWYPQAHEWMVGVVKAYRVHPHKVAGATAVLSPGVEWSVNQQQAEELVRVYRNKGNMYGVDLSTYPSQRYKARQILWSVKADFKTILGLVAKPRARKTRAFYAMLVDPGKDEVVLDRWMGRALGLGEKITPGQYKRVEGALKRLAEQEGEKASDVQATLWLRLKDLHEQGVVKGQEEMPF